MINIGSKQPHRKYIFALLLFLLPSYAQAITSGYAPSKINNWRISGSVSSTGRALMIPGPYYAEINSVLLPESSATISGIPYDGEVEAAYVFWSGSTPRTFDQPAAPDGPDYEIDLTLPDGTFLNNISALDIDSQGFNRCVSLDGLGGFYYCRRDVTSEIKNMGIGNTNGTYTLGDMDADPGTLDSNDPDWINAQAKYAGWSLIIIWKSNSYNQRRDIVLYDGFLRLDETSQSSGVHSFTIGDFLVGDPPRGEIRLFGLEGDKQLGVPPENYTGCPTCWDFVSFKTYSYPTTTYLSNGENPQYNAWNSTPDVSIDIDTYYLDMLLVPNDTKATIQIGSGDGIVGSGNGENFFLGWITLSLDTLAPNFSTTRTNKEVYPATAGGGERLTYVVELTNEGTADGTNVILTDSIPPFTSYIPNSTYVDGVQQPDIAGQSPLISGLNLGTVPYQGDNTKSITFEVRVDTDIACNSSISNTAYVTADDMESMAIGPAVSVIEAPNLDTPQLTVNTAVPGGKFEPGSAISYTFTIKNNNPFASGGLSIIDSIPDYINPNLVVTPPGASYTVNGNILTVNDISVPANASVQVVMLATIFSAVQFDLLGLAADEINGLIVSNQATIQGGCDVTLQTDDPAVGGITDPTDFTIEYHPAFETSSKTAVNITDSDPPTEPGDIIEFQINIVNTGNAGSSVLVRDTIGSHVEYLPGTTKLDGIPLADQSGQSPLVTGVNLGLVPYVGDTDRLISFQVKILDSVPNGFSINNTAHLVVSDFPLYNRDITSNSLTVFAAPEFTNSSKTVLDNNGGLAEPNDTLTYTITITNSGNKSASNVQIKDKLPSGLSFINASNGGTFDGTYISWPTITTLNAETSTTRTFQARIATPWNQPSTTISNIATIQSNETTLFSTSPALITVNAQPSLQAVKSYTDLNGNTAQPGDIIRYTITITNTGTANALDVVLTDTIDPATLTNITPQHGSFAGNTITWNNSTYNALGTITPGTPVTVSFEATIVNPLRNGTTINNQALITSANAGSLQTNITSLAVQSSVTAVVQKTFIDNNGGDPIPGDLITYTISIIASGNSPIWDAIITDTIPDQLTTIAPQSPGILSGNQITWNLAGNVITPQAPTTLSFTAVIAESTPNGTPISNQAQLISPALSGTVYSDDPGTTPIPDPTTFTVVSNPRLVLTKSVQLEDTNDSAFNPLDDIIYHLSITNTGTIAASNVVIIDGPLPSTLTNINPQSGTLSTNTITWNSSTTPALSSLDIGETVTISFNATITSPLDNESSISNQAQATCDEIANPTLSDDPNTVTVSDPTIFQIHSAPNFETSTKIATDISNGAPLRPGDTIRYTIAVTNTGNMNAHDVHISDDLNTNNVAHLVNNMVVSTEYSGQLLDNVAQWTIPSLPINTTQQVTIEATLNDSIDDGTLLINQATITSDEITAPTVTDDPSTMEADDPTRVQVVANVDLSQSTLMVTNISGTPITDAYPGEQVRYILTVQNKGDAPAYNVALELPIPTGFSLLSSSHNGINNDTSVSWSSQEIAALAVLATNDTPVQVSAVMQLQKPLDAGLLLNQAKIYAQDIIAPTLSDYNIATPGAQETPLNIIAAPILTTSTKTITDLQNNHLTTAKPGDTIRYNIVVTNTGDGWANNVVVTDVIDTTLLTAVIPRQTGVFDGNQVNWDKNTFSSLEKIGLGPDNAVTLQIIAEIRSPLEPTTLKNQATISADNIASVVTDDPYTATPGDSTALAINSQANLSTSRKIVSGDQDGSVAPGDVLTYTIVVENIGDAPAHNTIVSDVIDTTVLENIIPIQGNYDSGTKTITWQLQSVYPGSTQTKEVSFTAQVKSLLDNSTIISNAAAVVADDLTPIQTNQVDLLVTSSPNLDSSTLSVTPQTGNISPGDTLTFTIVVTNTGNAIAKQLQIQNPLPGELEIIAIGDNGYMQDNKVTWSADQTPALQQLLPDASITLQFTARIQSAIADGIVIANQATILADAMSALVTDDPSTPDVDDATLVTVSFADLSTSIKQVADLNGGEFNPNDEIKFSIVVTNSGSYPAQYVEVLDSNLDSNLITIRPDQGGIYSNNQITWNHNTTPSLSDIQPGESVDVGFFARIRPYLSNGTNIFNHAVINHAGYQFTTNTVEIPVVAYPAFELFTKTAYLGDSQTPISQQNGYIAPGEIIRYEIIAPNTGNTIAHDVTISDTVPSYLQILEVSDGGIIDSNTITWNFEEVYPQDYYTDEAQPVHVWVKALVRDSTPNNTAIHNQAHLHCSELEPLVSDDPTTSVLSDPTSLVVFAAPYFASTTLAVEDLNGENVETGDILRYKATVRNTGNREAINTYIRSFIPAYTTYITGTAMMNGIPIQDNGEFPFINSFSIQSPDQQQTGVVSIDDKQVPHDELVSIVFEVRINDNALAGTIIEAQVSIGADDITTTVSDNPNTPEITGDPTTIIVGGGTYLQFFKTYTLIDDQEQIGIVDVGDTIQFNFTISNHGNQPARNLVLTDIIDQHATYVEDSMLISNQPITDGNDHDNGFIEDSTINWTIPLISLGQTLEASFQVLLTEGSTVTNQATITDSEGYQIKSDGDAQLPGTQATIVPIGQEPEALKAVKEVVDLNGGEVEPGDTVRYTITIINQDSVSKTGLYIKDNLSTEFSDYKLVEIPSDADAQTDNWLITISNFEIAPNGSQQIIIDAHIREDIVLGTTIENIVEFGQRPGTMQSTEPVSVIVGSGGENGIFQGRVFRNLGNRQDSFIEGEDIGLEGYTIAVYKASEQTDETTDFAQYDPTIDKVNLLLETNTTEKGYFIARGIPKGVYDVILYSPSNTELKRESALSIGQDNDMFLHVSIDPSGVIYRETQEGDIVPVAGAQVYLVDDATGELVSDSLLRFGQQGQISTVEGFYQFDAPPGQYRITIDPPPSFVFPSTVYPPQGQSSDEPWGSFAETDVNGRVVEDDWPTQDTDFKYYLRFDLSDGRSVHNNHIPLDLLQQRISITKNSSHTTAQMGDIITYTITINNPTNEALLVSETGGVLINDAPSLGLKYVNNSVRLTSIAESVSTTAVEIPETINTDGSLIQFGPFDLPGQSTLRIRYNMVIGLRADKGETTNKARLVEAFSNNSLSQEVTATIFITEDPIFERSTIVGRVYCHQDGSSDLPELNKAGIPGARVFIDTGYYSETDPDGRYHFPGIKSGRHVIKVDPNTVPAGSTFLRGHLREHYFTPGLPAKIDFPVNCAYASFGAQKIKVSKTQPTLEPIETKDLQKVSITLDMNIPAISINNKAQPLPLIQVSAVPGGSKPDWQKAEPLNLDSSKPISFFTQSPANLSFETWELAVFEVQQQQPVWIKTGTGNIPKHIPWDLTDGKQQILKENTLYYYRLAALTTQGDMGESQWLPLAIKYGQSSNDNDEFKEFKTIRNDLFDENGISPSPELQTRLQQTAKELQSFNGNIQIEVHGSGLGSRIQAMLSTQRQAAAIKKVFIDAGLNADNIQSIGKGNTKPILPPITGMNQRRNQRVIINTKKTQTQMAKIQPIAYEAYASVNDSVYPIPISGRVEEVLYVTTHDHITIQLRQKNGQRILWEHAYPEDSNDDGQAGKVGIPISGNYNQALIYMDKRKISLPLLHSTCQINNKSVAITNDNLEQPLAFSVSSQSKTMKSWKIRIHNQQGDMLQELSGSTLDEPITWNGKNSAQNVILKPEKYDYHCIFTSSNGNQFVTPRKSFTITGTQKTNTQQLFKQVFSNIDFDKPLPDTVINELTGISQKAKDAGSHVSILVGVHSDGSGGPMKARLTTQRLARAVQIQFSQFGLPMESIIAKGFGSSKPLVPNLGPRNKSKNRRIEVELIQQIVKQEPKPTPVKAKPYKDSFMVNGQTLSFKKDSSFKGKIMTPADGPMTIVINRKTGEQARLQFNLINGTPLIDSANPSEQLTTTKLIGTVLADLNKDVATTTASNPAKEITTKIKTQTDTGLHQEASSDPLPVQTSDGSSFTIVAANQAPATSAGKLKIYWPRSAQLKGKQLSLRGLTAPENMVTVNGKPVLVNEDGSFGYAMRLEQGSHQIEVRTLDPQGNEAWATREFHVPTREFFALLFGDLTFGQGKPSQTGALSGTSTHSLYEFDTSGYQLFFNGRAVAYLKGWTAGSNIYKDFPIKEIRYTAHIDTAKTLQESMFNNFIDFERYYATFGDDAAIIQDAPSRGKLYLSVEADNSFIKVGNYNLSLGNGSTLFNYQRSLYGAQLHFDQTLDKKFRTRIDLFGADGQGLVQHRHILLRGTGGSLYYLKDRDVVEGSERIEVVVRDAISGMEIVRRSLTRNTDYTVRYDDGRIMLTQALPSTSTANIALYGLSSSNLTGNPVYIEISYDYRDDGLNPLKTDYAFGGWLEETFYDIVSIGIGGINETKADSQQPAYQLLGARLDIRPKPQTFLTAEAAWSKHVDTDHFMSLDGGITFAQIGWNEVERLPEGAVHAESGLALSVEMGTELAEWLNRDKPFLNLGAYAYWQEPSFYSSSSIFNQGQSKYGASALWHITEQDQIKLTHDGNWTHLPDLVGDYYRRMHRELSRLHYQHQEKTWNIGGEYGHSFVKDDAYTESIIADYAQLYVGFKPLERLSLRLGQEAVLGGDQRVLTDTWDHLSTSLGVQYQLNNWLQVQVEEALRWSGSNSTTVGLRTKISKTTELYANQRLTSLYGNFVSSTIIGGEQAIIKGNKTYAEYQYDTGTWGNTGKAVFGMDNQWEIMPGLALHLSYERSQIVGGTSSLSSNISPWSSTNVTLDQQNIQGSSTYVTGTGSGAANLYSSTYASSLNDAGIFPIGVSARDSLAAGLTYKGVRNLLISVKAEMRYDNADESLSGQDRLYTLSGIAAQWRLIRDLTLFARANYISIDNQTLERAEAMATESSLGLALRPVDYEWLTLLGKITHRRDRSPVSLTDGLFELEDATVLSLEPIFELPWTILHGVGMQVAMKFAVKSSQLVLDDLPTVRSSVALAIVRYNLHMFDLGKFGGIDLGAEYRFLWGLINSSGPDQLETENGALLEIAWSPKEFVTVGLGYNFTHFSDNLLTPRDYDPHGFYLRVTGKF